MPVTKPLPPLDCQFDPVPMREFLQLRIQDHQELCAVSLAELLRHAESLRQAPLNLRQLHALGSSLAMVGAPGLSAEVRARERLLSANAQSPADLQAFMALLAPALQEIITLVQQYTADPVQPAAPALSV